MGRPKQALISKQAVLKIALKIINDEGLAALSLRRIARQLNVNVASLYNHFENKNEIVVGAAELALQQTPLRLPLTESSKWQDLLFAGVLQERDFLLAHPDLLQVILRRRSEGFASPYLEHLTKRLLDLGVPIEIIDPIYDALECFTVGYIVRLTSEKNLSNPKTSSKTSLLIELENKRFIEGEEIFNASVLGIINGIERQYTLSK